MSELLPCPFCGSENVELSDAFSEDDELWTVVCNENDCCVGAFFEKAEDAAWSWNTRRLTMAREHSKYPLAPVSSTLDRLLAGFDGAAEAEADLGEIEHKGEKVVRGEG